MKMFSRVTNSLVTTAALLAVIISSLCFSVGEGLRLTPFPNPALSQNQDSNTAVDGGDSSQASLAKYGPLDVPAQKRSKHSVEELSSGAIARTQPIFNSIVHSFPYKAQHVSSLPLIASQSGRAPPLQS